jgi:putative nucleotidyltransferase with HDIG domain
MPSDNSFPPAFHPLKQETNQAVLTVAREAGVQIYLVGGYIRDALLNRYGNENCLVHDFDYAVLGRSAIEFGKALAEKLGGVFVLLDERTDTCRVVMEDGRQIDLAACVGGSLDADLHRRDLTVNALAWDSSRPDEIIDRVGGLDDLAEKRIRLVSEQSLIEDPLRLLRVFRFAAALDFSIEVEALAAVRAHVERLSSVAGERVTYELFGILDTPRAGKMITLMAETGLLEVIFPELVACRQVPTNSYHHLGLFEHSLQALIETETGFSDFPDWAQVSLAGSIGHKTSRLAAAKLAALLHDIGKPATWSVRQDGRHTFIGHDKLGAEMIEPTAVRLKWSRPLERFVAALVRWHLRPGALYHQGPPTQRAVYRFYREVGTEVPGLVLLALADFRSTRGPGLLEGRERLENQLRELLEGYAVFIEGQKQNAKMLDGRDVMDLLGIGPGPIIGLVLEDLEEARSLGEVTSKQQARDFVSERFKQKYCK